MRNPTSSISLLLLAAFTAFRLWQALLPPPGVWQDSISYEAAAGFPFWSTGFWAGQRPPLVPLLWKATGTPTSFVVTQTVIAAIAWGFLAITIGRLTRGSWRQVLAVAIVLLFACTLAVGEWDWSVLSESIALSSLAAIFAFAIRYAQSGSGYDSAGLIVCSVLFCLDRDEDLWTVGLLGLAALFSALAIARRRSHIRAGRTALLGLCLVVIAVLCEVPVVTSQRDVTYLDDIFAVRIFPFASRVAWFGAHGMPEANEIDQYAGAYPPSPGKATVVEIDLYGSRFGPLQRWIDTNGVSTYSLWLVEHPGFVLSAPFDQPPLTFNNANGDLSFYAAPGRVGTSLLDNILFPSLPGEILIVAAAVGFAAWRRERLNELWAIAVLAALGPISMLIAWQGEAQEVTRHMVEGSVEARLGILLLLVVAALGATPVTTPVTTPPGAEPGGQPGEQPGPLPIVPGAQQIVRNVQ
jgi:hypothetical protein